MTRADAREFLEIAGQIQLQPKTTVFRLEAANEALTAIRSDSLNGAAVIAI
jgi:alcohol dehydrogenase, propanol-preferring